MSIHSHSSSSYLILPRSSSFIGDYADGVRPKSPLISALYPAIWDSWESSKDNLGWYAKYRTKMPIRAAPVVSQTDPLLLSQTMMMPYPFLPAKTFWTTNKASILCDDLALLLLLHAGHHHHHHRWLPAHFGAATTHEIQMRKDQIRRYSPQNANDMWPQQCCCCFWKRSWTKIEIDSVEWCYNVKEARI